MQFLVTAYDGTDSEAAARRAAAQEPHRKLGYEMIRSGNILFSTAILGDHDETVGSLRVMQFDSRAELDEWLENEPYIKGGVWKDVKVQRCRMGPAFEWMTLEPGGARLSPSGGEAEAQ